MARGSWRMVREIRVRGAGSAVHADKEMESAVLHGGRPPRRHAARPQMVCALKRRTRHQNPDDIFPYTEWERIQPLIAILIVPGLAGGCPA